jgi:hypothetical protein
LALFFEHESIRRALVSAGLLQADQLLDSGSTTQPVFLGWTSKDLLLLKPANAWLSVEQCLFIRLPQPGAMVQQYLDQSAQPVVESEELKRLRTPLGQWRWAIAEFTKLSTAGAMEIAASELQRFAAKHWPGWYDDILSNLLADIRKGAQPTPQLAHLGKYAHRVAALNAVTPLIDWTTNKFKSNHIHTLAEVLAYSQQDLFDLQKIRNLGLDLDWLKLLANDCAETETALVIINEFEPSPWAELQESLHSVTQAVSELNSLDHFSSDYSLKQTQLASEQLTRGLTRMAHLRNAVKESLTQYSI